MSTERHAATVASVTVPGGLHVGLNTLHVTLLVYGQRTPVTVNASLTLPPGTPLTGDLRITLADSPSSGPDTSGPIDDRPSVADLVSELQSRPDNRDLLVSFQPSNDYGPDNAPAIGPQITHTSWVLSANSSLVWHTSQMHVVALPRAVTYGGSTIIAGEIDGPQDDTTVEIWARDNTTTAYSKIATVPAVLDEDGYATFFYHTSGLARSMHFKAVWNGDSESLGCYAAVGVPVAAKVLLAPSASTVRRGATVSLTATVRPAVTGQRVTFQRWVSSTRRWLTIGYASVSGGKATFRWRPSTRGVYSLRALVATRPENTAGTSATHRVTVK